MTKGNGLDPLRNKLDPLHAQPPNDKELFRLLAERCTGVPANLVVSAAANILINALRQQHPTQTQALNAYDEIFTKLRGVLAEHYDNAGKRRNVFPFDQRIEMPFWRSENKFFRS